VNQRAKVAADAERYDLEIVDVIVDAGVSAKTLDRPGLGKALAMLAGVREGSRGQREATRSGVPGAPECGGLACVPPSEGLSGLENKAPEVPEEGVEPPT
jgi:hypothetical protein